MLEHWIWLTTRKGVGCRYGSLLLSHFSDMEAAYFADEKAYRLIPGLPKRAVEGLMDKSLDGAERILEECYEKNIQIMTIADGIYPARLRNIPDPPLVLYYKGKLPNVDSLPVVGVVGTRSATPYGLLTAKRLGYQLGKCGAVLVSGMAKGIDAMAMIGALTAGQKVIGVLGSGADIIYPRSNASLFADTEANGCLLSEFPPGTPPEANNFPRRNRIMSGLSCGVLVVEAPLKSGALITAQAALDQGRDVFVVPGNIDVPASEGSNKLLREGAIAVTKGWDIVSEYQNLFPGKITSDENAAVLTAHSAEIRRNLADSAQGLQSVAQKVEKPQANSEKKIDKLPRRAYIDLDEIMPLLSADEKQVAAKLTEESCHVDELIEKTGLPVARVLASLTLLEVKGIAERRPGKYYCLGRKRQ
ncbi:MAG: DNA-protecting protein DprA [Oscillospiraceae bacterium]|nr:DNA-protecting protein DprA [Oscillospiraceae bacterium]